MNKHEDAIHSAKLAVDIAHDHLEKTVDEIFVNGNEDEGDSTVGGVRVSLGPILSSNLLLIFAYFNLATQLRHSDVVEASLTWYEKAIQMAESNCIDEDIISVLTAGLSDAEKYLQSVNYDALKNIQAHDTMVSDRISSGIEGLEAPRGTDNGRAMGRGYARSGTSTSSRSGRSRSQQNNDHHKPSGSEASMTSSERNDPANYDRDTHGHGHGHGNDQHDIYVDSSPPDTTQDGRSQDDQYRVENMTNNSTIPTQTPMSGGGTAYSGFGGATRGYKSNKRHDPNSTNDDISHITGDDENPAPHYFYPTQRPRPKSALSKLGREHDSSSVQSAASTPKSVRQKRHSFSGGETPRGEALTPGKGGGGSSGWSTASSLGSTKKYHTQQLNQEQLYDNSEVNRIVVERSMEWNGQESTDVPTPTLEMLLAAEVKDPMLQSLQETLSKQLNSMIQFREKVYQHKKEVKQQEQVLQSRKRKEAKNIAKAERKKSLSRAVEMNFERRCAQDDRVAIYDSILKAQRLKAADDIQFVERGSEHFFEGMVVDVKRSAKANSDRDRCVIVRARVNGSFDAEIIESGELLINIHPNVIRIPTLPNNKDRLVACEYEVGQQVSCRAGKYGRWFTGFVEKVHVAGQYKIEFADGTVEDNVPHKRMRPAKKLSDKDPNGGFDIALIEHEYYVGQEVLMRFPYGSKWRLCTITKVRCDGEAYDVLLNGRQEAEKGVSSNCLRHQGSLLYGYGDEFCPSRKALARCASTQSQSPDGVQSPNQFTQNQKQDRVYINQQGEYALRTPSRPTRPPTQALPAATTGKKSNRQIEDGNLLAVSRSDRNIEVKHFMSPPSKLPPTAANSSPIKQEKGMAAPPSSNLRVTSNPASNGVVISTMRDRFVQEMHRNVSLLNTSATERKFARIIRQERLRIDSIVRIQACMRGYLVRSKMKYVSQHEMSSKHLQGNEFDLSTAQIDLMDRYMQALSVAIFKNDASQEGDQSPSRPMVASSLAAMKKVADLITSDLPEEFDMENAVEVNPFENITDPVEKMKLEMMEIHQQQLQKQRDEMKEMFTNEMRGLGSKIIRNIHHEGEDEEEEGAHPGVSMGASGILGASKQSGVGDSTSFLLLQHAMSQEQGLLMNTQSSTRRTENDEEDDGYVFGMDDSVPHDIDWMKDMYLDIWGNAVFTPVEVVSIIAQSQTEFAFIEASLPDELHDVVHMTGGSHDFVQSHHIFFVKTPENKDNFAMKVRLENATGKACKLKCPGDKIADLCESKRSVKITLDSKNQFDIASSSLRLDMLAQCLESLWDGHLAWMAQKLLIRIALHRVVQGICALFVSFPGTITDEMSSIVESTTEVVEGETKEKKEMTETETETETDEHAGERGDEIEEESERPQTHTVATWISHRYVLFQELSAILKSGQEQYKAYQESHERNQEMLTEIIAKWRFFQTNDATFSSGIPAYELSEQLYQLADVLFAPYETLFTAQACAASESMIDSQIIKDSLEEKYQHTTIQPILKDIFMNFVACFSVEGVFDNFFLSPLLNISHQKLVKGYAYAETYDWQSLCAHTRTWAFLLQGRVTDVSSPEFQMIYEKFLDIVLQADAEVYNAMPISEEESVSGGVNKEKEEGVEEQKDRPDADALVSSSTQMCGGEVVAAIEDFASRALSNYFE